MFTFLVLTCALIGLGESRLQFGRLGGRQGGRPVGPQPQRETEEAFWKSIKKYNDFEIREYPAAPWVCTSVRDNQFMTLFAYINGRNDAGAKVPMTKPVTREKIPESDMSVTTSMCFYIPSDYQTNPPTPSDRNVRIVQAPTRTFAVRVFESTFKAPEEQWLSEYKNLKSMLEEHEEIEFDVSDPVFFSGYQAPFMPNHRNEVWIQVEPMEMDEN